MSRLSAWVRIEMAPPCVKKLPKDSLLGVTSIVGGDWQMDICRLSG